MSFITQEAGILRYLQAQDISYSRIEHPPVFTCAEAAPFRLDLPALETKNLFLRDEQQHFFLIMTACKKRLDLKGLGRALGLQKLGGKKLHFGSPEQLLELLGLDARVGKPAGAGQ